jgi:hypothetical protein
LTQAEGATAITQPACAIVQPRACPQAPQATTERQDSEYIDINNHSEVDEAEDVEHPVSQARAPHAAGGATQYDPALDSTNTTAVDPLATDPQTQKRLALDIHHFFIKVKGESATCKPCK